MSKTKTYSEKLKDPRWQKKRLEILNQWGFKCLQCDSTEKTLHVHHKFYKKNANPWDYENHELEPLCEDCHKHREELRFLAIRKIGFFDNQNLEMLIKVLNLTDFGPWSFGNLANFLTQFASDIQDMYGCSQEEDEDAS